MSTVQKVWDKTSIHALLDRNPTAVVKGIRALAARQTADELATHHTSHANGAGFNKHDAPFLTDILRQINAGRGLSEKQLAVCRNKVKRYWRQLAEIANESAQRLSTSVAVEPQHENALEAVASSFDASVRRAGTRALEARDEVLAELECNCENYDGERKCDFCLRSGRFDAYRDAIASW